MIYIYMLKYAYRYMIDAIIHACTYMIHSIYTNMHTHTHTYRGKVAIGFSRIQGRVGGLYIMAQPWRHHNLRK